MSKKKKTLVAVFALLVIAALGLAGAVYAKYIASITGNDTATVAKWAFKSENENKQDFLTCDLKYSYDEATLVDGKIAPGTEGSCVFEISNEESEVGVDYKIVASAANKPTNLKFYTDDTYQTELTAAGISGHLDAAATTANTETIYWRWEYETGAVTNGVAAGDEADTANGVNPAAMTMDFAISGVQARPTHQ